MPGLRSVTWVTFILVLLLGMGCSGTATKRLPMDEPVAVKTPSAPSPRSNPQPNDLSEPTITHPEIGFASAKKLEEHFRKHGREFSASSQEAYLQLAQEMRDRPVHEPLLEARRGDGVITRFDRESGAFLAFNPDLTIRTFFRPNDGEDYFRRQLDR